MFAITGIGLILCGFLLFQSSIVYWNAGAELPVVSSEPNTYRYPLDVIGIAILVAGAIIVAVDLLILYRGKNGFFRDD